MSRNRLVGIILMTIGFVLTLGFGLYLASRASDVQTGDVVTIAAVAFVVIAPFVFGGLYLYFKDQTEDDIVVNNEMQKHRLLVDMLVAQRTLPVTEAAAALEVTPQEIFDMVDELMGLDIFPGFIDRDNAILHYQR